LAPPSRFGRYGPRRIVRHRLPDAAGELVQLRAGLLGTPARIEPKYFYDDAGCALFGAICDLPEYYLTRTEAAIFQRYRRQIAAQLPAALQWVDLGCGDGHKSRAWIRATGARRFVGVDIADGCLATTVDGMEAHFPQLECVGVVTDLSAPLGLQSLLAERPDWPPVFFYPGSSLGNFTPPAALRLLRGIRDHLGDEGGLVIGVDLVKDARRLEAAYDDSRGVTAAFNLNVLEVVNRLLDADFEPDRFEHCARFDAAASRIEMHLRARETHRVRIGTAQREFAAGETILTEYSHKYTVEGLARLLADAGFSRRRVWTDDRQWFAVALARP
jgi:dimethylhistidine N-methyltransferase